MSQEYLLTSDQTEMGGGQCPIDAKLGNLVVMLSMNGQLRYTLDPKMCAEWCPPRAPLSTMVDVTHCMGSISNINEALPLTSSKLHPLIYILTVRYSPISGGKVFTEPYRTK